MVAEAPSRRSHSDITFSIGRQSHRWLWRIKRSAANPANVAVYEAAWVGALTGTARIEAGLASVLESVPLLDVHNSNKTSTIAVAKITAMAQIDGGCFRPYIATSLGSSFTGVALNRHDACLEELRSGHATG